MWKYYRDVNPSGPDVLLRVEYGSYFGGACEIILLKRDNETAVCYINGYNGWKMGTEKFTFPAKELERIEKAVAPVKAWKPKYESEYNILDGYGWNIRTNFGETVESDGYMAYPDDYAPVMRAILDSIEAIRAYDDGEQKNIPLLSPGNGGWAFFVAGKKE